MMTVKVRASKEYNVEIGDGIVSKLGEMTKAVCDAVNIPVIASGGCGSLEHFAEAFTEAGADAALAASLFHYGELTVSQVKDYLRGRDIPVR